MPKKDPRDSYLKLQGNIGNLFVKQVTSHKTVSGHWILCIDRGPSPFCEMSAMVTNYVTDPPKLICDCLLKVVGS